MKRRTLDLIFSVGGGLLAILLLVLGLVLQSQANFADSYVTDQLTRELEEMGLQRFGRQGDPFDESLHQPVGEVSGDSLVAVPTCKVVKRVGYTMGDEVLRRAQVVVALPSHPGALFSGPSA